MVAKDESADLKRFLIKASVIVGSGGLIFGYDIGVISGALGQIKDEFDLSSLEAGVVVSILYAGSVFGSSFGGQLCDSIGRWRTIQIQNFVFILGAIMTGLATDLATLCVGRFTIGIASALSGIADVPYLTEIAPVEYRGFLASQYEMLVSLGIIISFIVDLIFSGLSYGWRIAFLIPVGAALAQSVGLFWLPESPKWLIENRKLPEAKNALAQMYGSEAIEEKAENANITENLKERLSDQGSVIEKSIVQDILDYRQAKKAFDQTGGEVKRQQCCGPKMLAVEEKRQFDEYTYALFVAIFVQFLSQVTGANVIRNYAPTIFEDGGVSDTLSLIYNVLFGVVKFVFTAISINYIDIVGRLKLFLYSIWLVGFGMLFLTVASVSSSGGNLSQPAVFVVGCCLIYAGFGLGYGPVPWVLSSEMFPALIRGRVMCLSLIASNVTQLVTNLVFLPMVDGITSAGAFSFFLLMNVFALVFTLSFVVETKEITHDIVLKRLNAKYTESLKMWSSLQCFRIFCNKPDELDGLLLHERSESTA